MANGDNAAYDYRTDPEFVKARPDMMVAYLKQVDPDFAQASAADQAAYISYLKGLDQPTQFEQQRGEGPDRGFWSHVGDYLKAQAGTPPETFKDAVMHGLKQLDPRESIGGQVIKAITGTIPQEYFAARERGHGPAYSAAAGASTAVGVRPEEMEKAAETGDTAGVLGEVAVPTALAVSPLAAEGIAKSGLPTAARDIASKAVYTEENKMRPVAKTAAKVTGALVGHATGLPEAGVVGYLEGPRVLESIVPKRAAPATYPGAPLPEAGEFYAKRGAEMDAIRKMNALAERVKAREAVAQAKAAREELPEQQVFTVPVPREPLPGENPNYMASVPRGTLPELAAGGKPGAATQLQNLGRKILYVPESYPTGPKVTGELPGGPASFSAEIPAQPASAQLAGGPKSFGKLALSEGEDLGPGMGNEHVITNEAGDRVGSIQIEQTGPNGIHVHWLGGEFGPGARTAIRDAIEEKYPGTKNITYDRRRLAKGAGAATTEAREMKLR